MQESFIGHTLYAIISPVCRYRRVVCVREVWCGVSKKQIIIYVEKIVCEKQTDGVRQNTEYAVGVSVPTEHKCHLCVARPKSYQVHNSGCVEPLK